LKPKIFTQKKPTQHTDYKILTTKNKLNILNNPILNIGYIRILMEDFYLRSMYSKLFFLATMVISGFTLKAQIISEQLKNLPLGRTNQQVTFKYDNQSSYIPYSLIKGKFDGPVFTIIAGIHGFEYPPIVAVQEILKTVEAEKLHGTLIVVPVANVASFYGRSPFVNPLDGKNLNNAFPGTANGSMTEQIANWISTEIIPNSDVFLDIHAGDASEDLLPFVCYYNNTSFPAQTQKSQQLAEQSGFNHIISYPYTLKPTEAAKYAFKQAVQVGKTGLSIEAGKLGNVQYAQVAKIVQAVRNMLSFMDMYEKKPSSAVKQKLVYLNNQEYVKATEQGIFTSKFKSGQQVQKGAIIGEIRNEFGEVKSTLTCPVSGTILYKIGTPPVNTGETVFCIGY